MPNVIDRVRISGFWGDKTAALTFGPHRNFIIGVNGSGKTTFIDLLSATLRMDFETLARLDFDEISIVLKTVGRNQKPVIKVSKHFLNEYLPKITYSVQESTTGSITVYDFDDFADIRMARRRRYSPRNEAQHQGLQEQLAKLLSISWLPIWRGMPMAGRDLDEKMQPSIDHKLVQITRGFATYFSALQTMSQRDTDAFQERVFLSLITAPEKGNLLSLRHPQTDQASEQSELDDIFSEFNLDRKKYRRHIVAHFDRLRTAVQKVEDQNSPLEIEDLMAIFDNRRISRLAKDWRELQRGRSRIYSLRDLFIRRMNELLSRKTIRITERNEVEVVTQSGKVFDPSFLSSGEKQLFIMLGEVMLFEKNPFVLIADEPELSLHVRWQSELVTSIQQLNENVQMIFATHSPDIVGGFSADIIKIEDHIS
jgi:predicted ATP-dependent endonuclease of OLD family